MSNRRKSALERAQARWRMWVCPKCGNKDNLSKEYDDAWLYICGRCEFPERVMK